MQPVLIFVLAVFLSRACLAQDPQWVPVGPAPQTASDGTKVSGRVTCIAISSNFDGHGHPAMYLGTYGGIWRSSNFTATTPMWRPLTDQLGAPISNQAGLLTINSIAVDPNNARRIFAAAGDPAQGVLRSLDGGNTWKLVGSATFAGTWPIGKILIDPTDKSGNTVYLSGSIAGVYKSTDGGDNWSAMATGLPPTSFRVSDMEYTISRSKALAIYIAVSYSASAADKGIWVSKDAAQNWAHLSATLADIDTGLSAAADAIGLTKLAADHRPDAPAGVYAAIGNLATNFLLNVVHFTDSSATGTLAGGDLPTPRKVFNQGVNIPIAVSPSGEVYLGTAAHIAPFVSSDGGTHWQALNTGSNNITPHVDDWAWAFWGNAVYSGNDGGIWRYDRLNKNWESLNTAGLQTNLVNGVSAHPVYPNVYLIGSQDNETALRTNGSWKSVTGGPADGGAVRFDPDPSNTNSYAYTAGPPDPNPNFLFRLDGLNATSWKSIGFFNDNLVPFYSLFSIVPSDSKRLLLPLGQVFESVDRGVSWNAISQVFVNKQTPASAIAHSSDGQTIYVAYGSQLFHTVNGGGDGTSSNWKSVVITVTGSIMALAVDPDTADTAYVATSSGQIWRTLDGSTTWTNISGNLPAVRINAIALKGPTLPDGAAVFLGTNVGVYASFTQRGDFSWQPLGGGLPTINVTDLQYNSRTKYLSAGTYGRGVFTAYLHFSSAVSPGAASLGQQLFVFGTETSGNIQRNQATLGQAFSGWFDVQGGGHTDAAPAPASASNTIFLFVKGLDGLIYLNQADLGHPFGDWFQVPGNFRTDRPPSATSVEKTLFVFAKGLDGRVFSNQADVGHAFGDWFAVQGVMRTDRSPSAAAVSKTIFVFAKGLDNQIHVNQADFGHAFGDWFPVPGNRSTDQAPAATAVGQSIFVFIKGLDGRIYLNQAQLGHAFSGWFEVQGNGLTDQAPAAATVGQTVFVFIKGLDGHTYVNQADFGHPFGAWFEVGGGLQ